LIQLCKLAERIFSLPRNGRCPALEFEGTKSRCGIVDLVKLDEREHAIVLRQIGAGEGCSIEAMARGRDGNFYEFQFLPDQTKIDLAQLQIKEPAALTVLYRRKK